MAERARQLLVVGQVTADAHHGLRHPRRCTTDRLLRLI
jgi:hypothetical protein